MFFSKTDLNSIKAINLNTLDSKEMSMIVGGCGRKRQSCQPRHNHEQKRRGGGCHSTPTPPPAPTPVPPAATDENDINGF